MVRDLVSYLPAKAIPAVLTLIVVTLLTHALPPEEFGRYATIMAAVALANIAVVAWLRQSVLRFYPAYIIDGRQRHFQATALTLLVLVIAVVGVALTGILAMAGFSLRDAALGGLINAAFALFDYQITLYQSARGSTRYAVVSIGQSVVQSVWVCVFVYWARGGYAAALGAVLAGLSAALVYGLATRRQAQFHPTLSGRKLDRPLVAQLVGYGLPMAAWLFAFQSLSIGSRLIIGWSRGPAEVGIYSSTYDLINGGLSLMMTPFLLAAHPLIVQLWTAGAERKIVEDVIEQVLRYLLLMFVPVFALAVLFGPRLLFMLGPGFAVDRWVVPVLVLATFLGGFAMYAHKGLEMANRTGVMLGAALVTVAVDITLKLVLIRPFGYAAAALISVASYVLYIVITYRIGARYLRVRYSRMTVARVAIAGGLAAAAAGLASKFAASLGMAEVSTELSTGVVLIAVYLALLLVAGELGQERTALAALLARRRAHDGRRSAGS